jgi:hypothetical protein
MATAPQLLLEELLFPVLELRTNPAHNQQGDRAGTQLQYGQQVQRLEGEGNRYGLMVSVRSDPETSKNPPYNFTVEAYAIFAASGVEPNTEASSDLVLKNGLPIVMGAIRERLAELSARAPWGRFLINTVGLPEPTSISYI